MLGTHSLGPANSSGYLRVEVLSKSTLPSGVRYGSTISPSLSQPSDRFSVDAGDPVRVAIGSGAVPIWQVHPSSAQNQRRCRHWRVHQGRFGPPLLPLLAGKGQRAVVAENERTACPR